MEEHLSSSLNRKKLNLPSLSAVDPRPSSKFPPFANSHVLAIDDRLLCLITGVLILLILGAKPNKLSRAKQKHLTKHDLISGLYEPLHYAIGALR